MFKRLKKYLVLSMVMVLTVVAVPQTAFADAALDVQINKTAAYMQSLNKTDWTAFGLARSDVSVPQSYYDSYYSGVKAEVKDSKGILSSNKYTEYSKKVLALTAIGKAPEDVEGYDLLSPLSDFDKVIIQGVNGPAYALIAFDSYNYSSDMREKYLSYIISKELPGGGFSLSSEPGDSVDPDVTAMVLQALSNYSDRNNIKAVIDRGVSALSGTEPSGAESLAQIIVAYATLEIDPSDHVKELLKYANSNGGFAHIKGSNSNAIATEQSFYALVAYDRYLKGKSPLYDMTGTTRAGQVTVTYNGAFIAFDQKPEVIKGRTFVPVRALCEAMGAEVIWKRSGSDKSVIIKYEGKVMELKIGSKTMVLDGKEISFDRAPYIKNSRTLVPIRYIAEAFDCQVNWIQSSLRVEVTSNVQ